MLGRIILGVACMLLWNGCLYSSHHFGGGRLLEPGRSSFALGAGAYSAMSIGCADYSESLIRTGSGPRCERWDMGGIDSNGMPVYGQDTVAASLESGYGPGASLGWRLGLAGAFGPFRGAELGIHLEAPTNPVTAEFDLKVGLPAPAGSFRHALAAGWGIGMWADNTWFGEYAASREFGRHSLIGNYRATWLATQPYDLKDAVDDRIFTPRRRLIHQGALGFAWSLGKGWPEFLAPLVLATYPQAPYGDQAIPAPMLREAAWNVAFGVRWGLK